MGAKMIVTSQYYRPPSTPYTAWWKLETDGSDYSGNGYNLTTVGSVPFGVNGGYASAGQFNDSNYFSVPSTVVSLIQASSNWYVEFDIYPTDWSNYNTVINFGTNDFMGINSGAGTALWNDGNGPGGFFVSLSTIPLNNWTTVKFSWNGTTRKVYLNGILNNSSISNGAILGALTSDIGHHTSFGNLYLRGYLKQFKIFIN